MFQITRKQLSTGGFRAAIQKLSTQELPVKAAYNVKKLTEAVQKAMRQIPIDYEEQVGKVYGEKDPATGTWKSNDDGSLTVLEDKKEAYIAAEKAFADGLVTIDRNKLEFETLYGLKLSAAALTALEPILTEPSEAPPAEVVSIR